MDEQGDEYSGIRELIMYYMFDYKYTVINADYSRDVYIENVNASLSSGLLLSV